MTEPLRILIAEDLESDAELEERELRRAGITFVSQRVETRATFIAALAEFQPDLILSDYRMPMFDGMEALALATELAPRTPLIIVTGSVNEGTAVECIKSGAVDYVLKGHLGRLAPAVRAALEQRRAESEKRTAEEALLASEQRFRQLVEGAPEGIVVHQGGRFIYANAAAARLFGAQHPGDLLGLPLLERVHPAFRDLVRDRVGRIQEQGRVAEPLEEILLRLDGSPFDAEVVGVPFSHEGKPATLAFFHDITSRKLAEAERALLGAAIEQAAELVIITDTSGAIKYVNSAFERITGWRRAEVMGQNPRILKSGAQEPEFYREMWAALTAGGVANVTFVNKRKDGGHYEAEVVIFPVRDPAGRITQYVGLQRDVTREHELAEQLRQSQKMEALGQLTGGITHDFNNLLGVILANAELLKPRVSADDPEVTRCVDDLTEAARRASTMVRKLLAFSRRERLTLQPVDLGRALHDIEQTLHRLLPETIEIELVAPVEGPTVTADPGAMEQILLNLATNARDAMPQGGTLSIRVEPWEPPSVPAAEPAGLAAPGAYVCVAVTDSGTGMDAATAARAMEPFFTTKPRGEGTGLGLAMVYGLMHQQGGQALLSSARGAGTTVRLVFRTGALETPAERPAERAIVQGSGTILVVEDQAMLRRAISEVLHRLGYTVIATSDGLEALDVLAARGAEIRVVLSDVVMPRMGGIRLYERLRELGNPVPVILMSGYAADGGETAMPPGVPMIEKPWTVEALARQVSAVLGRGSAP